jgi:hypothetical protein
MPPRSPFRAGAEAWGRARVRALRWAVCWGHVCFVILGSCLLAFVR